jgi:hypothetical protein
VQKKGCTDFANIYSKSTSDKGETHSTKGGKFRLKDLTGEDIWEIRHRWMDDIKMDIKKRVVKIHSSE